MSSQLKRMDLGDGLVLFYDAEIGAVAHLDIVGGPCTLLSMSGKNRLNDEAVYFELYDNAAPSVGSTEPVERMMVEAGDDTGDGSENTSAGLNNGFAHQSVHPGTGLPFANGLSLACVKAAGSSTAPDQAVEVNLLVQT